jgi:glutathione S-transferase
MKFFQFSYSPFAAKARTCLKLKGLTCQLVEVPYTQRKELVAATGAMQVPVLVDGDRVISDSPRIVAYLEDKGGPSLSVDPLAVVFEQWADEYFEEVAFKYACPGLEDRMGEEQGEEARALFRLIKERRYGPGAVGDARVCAHRLRDAAPSTADRLVSSVAGVKCTVKRRSHCVTRAQGLSSTT